MNEKNSNGQNQGESFQPSSAESGRRRFLTVVTSAIAGAGVAVAAMPFLSYWKPSAKAQASAAPVTINPQKLEPGQMITVPWQGKPVWVLRRTEQNLERLKMAVHREKLRDPDSEVNHQPDYAKNEFRSIKPELFVAVGICTHLGCVPIYEKDGRAGVDHALYFCPCHGSKFDLAGRVFKNVPAPTNLIIPPHHYDKNQIIVGEHTA